MALRFDAEQRFTCRSCVRCCTRWEIVVTAAEVDSYRRAKAGRWFREREEAPEGTEADPFEPIAGGAYRIRKRPDGACGFLSPQNLCRIHEEMGGARKPLTCRLFPFRFHPADGPPVLTLSFSCPTVVENVGSPVGSLEELRGLQKEYFRAYPEANVEIAFLRGRPMRFGALGALREALRQMLDRPGPGGADLRANVARMGASLEDLSRPRVLRLKDEDFAEYVRVTGRYAAKADKPAPRRPASRLSRLLFRGFLFAVVAARLQAEARRASGPRLRLRWRLLRVLLHLHGLWPAVAGVDLRAARRVGGDPLADPSVRALARNYLRATIETIGTGRRPALEELSVAVAILNAGGVLAAMRAGREGRTAVEATDFTAGLAEAADLAHAETGRVLSSLLATFSGGVEALYQFAEGGPLTSAR